MKDEDPTPSEEAKAEDRYQCLDLELAPARLRGLDWPYTIFDLTTDRSER